METKVLFVSPTLSAAAWVRSAGRIDFFEFEDVGFRPKTGPACRSGFTSRVIPMAVDF